ncbi:toll/interleukin-1 receptor domain-containing protein [Sphingomonas sp. CGMCC 1.13654]|uniref:Toll/interleukin-1 receptor domain-containing protein n=1 Tax=Sphingomonas chungangi TaxID=2683589 RepID=A0A838L674_9SPHN|nr:toll/interleukin-1 receptor domain-containing protein [Sphingomonas chungangi]MVW57085.1 TIR domain-containing protein [Sphingomonas chungangi]
MTVFLSHAGADKPKLASLVRALVMRGLPLFIDHPEKIDPEYSTKDMCDRCGIEALWTQAQDQWDEALRDKIDEAECVLAILSKEVINEHREMVLEWGGANQLRKLVLCAIEEFDISKLPSAIRTTDVFELWNVPEGKMEAGYDRLSDQYINRVINRVRAGGSAQDRMRQLGEQLPAGVARNEQRKAILRSCDRIRNGRGIVPVIVVGPLNETPNGFMKALGLSDDGSGSEDHFTLKNISWPEGPIKDDAFVRSYAENVGSGICGSISAGVQSVQEQIGKIGHWVVAHSRCDILVRDLSTVQIADWLRYWSDFSEEAPATKIVPFLSLFLKRAKPGWEDWPPTEDENATERERNAFILRQLREASKGAPPIEVRFDLPDLTRPVKLSHAQSWAENLAETIVSPQRRDLILDAINGELYGDDDAVNFGVNYEAFVKVMKKALTD